MFEISFILFHEILIKMVFVKASPEKQLFFKKLDYSIHFTLCRR